jgi:hypothetical protein
MGLVDFPITLVDSIACIIARRGYFIFQATFEVAVAAAMGLTMMNILPARNTGPLASTQYH